MMSAPEFMDLVLTPLGVGLGVYVAARFSPQLRQQSTNHKALMVIAAIAIVGGLKWSNIV